MANKLIENVEIINRCWNDANEALGDLKKIVSKAMRVKSLIEPDMTQEEIQKALELGQRVMNKIDLQELNKTITALKDALLADEVIS